LKLFHNTVSGLFFEDAIHAGDLLQALKLTALVTRCQTPWHACATGSACSAVVRVPVEGE
jgi:hypothetical protein